MTLNPIEQFRNALISATSTADPVLWSEASSRYDAAERSLSLLPPEARYSAAKALYSLLPPEWPFWMEVCREQGSDGLHWWPGLREAAMLPCRGALRTGHRGGASLRH